MSDKYTDFLAIEGLRKKIGIFTEAVRCPEVLSVEYSVWGEERLRVNRFLDGDSSLILFDTVFLQAHSGIRVVAKSILTPSEDGFWSFTEYVPGEVSTFISRGVITEVRGVKLKLRDVTTSDTLIPEQVRKYFKDLKATNHVHEVIFLDLDIEII